jgi:putative transposase
MPIYHAWFATKRRKWLLQGDIDDIVKDLICSTCSQREIDLIECETAVDHVHVLLRAADRQALSRAMNFIKGTTSRRLFEKLPELKLDIGMNNFWQHRYGWKVVPEGGVAPVAQYIRTQKERLEKYAR